MISPGRPGVLHRGMRTRSARAPKCDMCGARMKKNGRDRCGRQRWVCPACRMTTRAGNGARRRRAQLGEFLGWLLSPSPQPDGACAFRKRTGWCWSLCPRIGTDGVVRHVIMADGTYLRHGRCLLVLADGLTGEVLAWRWCVHETTGEYEALFALVPAPDVLVCDGMRGIEAACASAWSRTRIQRCLVHVQRDARRDLTSRPRLQAGRELKRLADALLAVRDAGRSAAWGAQLND